MKRCHITVLPTAPRRGITIWCDTCYENVAWDETFTEEEVVATAKGHRKVMARARQIERERKR